MDQTLKALPNYRWNFVFFVVDYVFFSVALSFANPNSVLPAFVGQFTSSAPVIGLVATVWHGLWLLPQVVAARAINDKPRKKPYLMAGISGRIAFWIMPLALWLGLAQRPVAMLILFFACLSIFVIPDGLASVAWFDMLARAIPVQRRGRLIGIAQSLSGLAGLGVGAIIGLILGNPRTPFPTDYALIFTLAGVAFLPSTIALALLRENQTDTARPEADRRGPNSWLTPFRHDPTFRRLMLVRVLVGMVTLATPFYVIHATEILGLPLAVVGGFVAAQQVAGVAFGAVLGPLTDRWGPAAAIRIGNVFSVAGPVIALAAHLAGGGLLVQAYPLAYVALGAHQSVNMLGYYNYLLEIAPDRVRSSYVGLGNTMMGVLTVSPILGGWLLEATSYTALFGITAGLVLVGALIALRLGPAVETALRDEQ